MRIDAAGRWILPGLIDGHIHLFQSGGLYARPDVVPAPLPEGRTYRDLVGEIRAAPELYLRAYLCSGITSVVDFGGPRWEFELRTRAESDPRLPRMAFTGPLLMTGNGLDAPRPGAGPPVLSLEDGNPFWPLGNEEEARRQIQRLLPYRPDFVKIVFMPRAEPDDLAARTKILQTAIAAVHEAKVRVAVHATTLDAAAAAVGAGADILVHSVADRDVDDAFVNAVVSRKVLVSPTLIVGANYREALSGRVALEDFERKCAPANTVTSFDLLPSLKILRDRPDALAVQKRNLKRLADAGAIIYASSDAGNTRTLHGPSLHRELALMADAGLRPMDILVAATRTNARLMRREQELSNTSCYLVSDGLAPPQTAARRERNTTESGDLNPPGPPPRTRGALQSGLCVGHQQRTTPAHAGSTLMTSDVSGTRPILSRPASSSGRHDPPVAGSVSRDAKRDSPGVGDLAAHRLSTAKLRSPLVAK